MSKKDYALFPTMITPYTKDNNIDFENIDKLVEWYCSNGCDGIFAVCQSSEMMYLSLSERVCIARAVVDKVEEISKKTGKKKMTVVASGHISDSFDEQVCEITEISKTGVDAVILVSNRLDIENTSDDKWIEDLKKLLSALPEDIKLGMYECPRPYKRLLTEKMIKFMMETNRFFFIKDTCCDADEIAKRVNLIKGSTIKLYNANAQTLLETLECGGDGYCGIMANFHPRIYRKLIDNIDNDKKNIIQSYICMSAFIENSAYPSLAKYYLNEYEGFDMSIQSRSTDYRLVNSYQKSCVRQMKILGDYVSSNL